MIRTLGFCSGLIAIVCCSGAAFADPTAADRATARSLAGDGYEALQNRDYATAVDRFSRADALVHAPTLMIDWARALVGLGKFVEAQERCEQIIREGVDAKSPKSWTRALADAGSELAALKPRLAWVTISVTGSRDARVTIDGSPVPPAAIGVRRAINPGERWVRVVAKGYFAQKKKLELAEGAEARADFSLQLDPDQQVVGSAVLDAPASVVVPAPSAPRSPVPMALAFAVGGASVVVGGIAGALAMHDHSRLSHRCPSSGACTEADRSVLNTYHAEANVANVGFAVGAAGLGTGFILWLVNRKAGEGSAQHGLAVSPYAGFASLGALGQF